MALADFTPITRKISYLGVELELHPLTMDEVVGLLSEHGGFISEALDRFLPQVSSFDVGTSSLFMSHLLAGCPPLIANIIATAAHEPGEADCVRLMPFHVQFHLVTVIIEMTFADCASADLVRQVAETIQPLTAELGLTRH